MTAAELASITNVAAAVLGRLTYCSVTLSCTATEAEVTQWAELVAGEVRKSLTIYEGEPAKLIISGHKTIGTVSFTLQGARAATPLDAAALKARLYRGSEQASPEEIAAALKLEADVAELGSRAQRTISGDP